MIINFSYQFSVRYIIYLIFNFYYYENFKFNRFWVVAYVK
jgi:hypothetical protein